MLNLEEIAQRIAQPNVCSSNDLEDLKLFSEKYPYSQVFPLLYLNTLAMNADVRFDEELHRFAYQISDRAQLYQLIHQNNTATSESIQAVEEREEPQMVEVAPIVEVTNENSVASSEIIESVKEEEVIEEETIQPVYTSLIREEVLEENLEDEEGFIPLTIASSAEKTQALNQEESEEDLTFESTSFENEIIAEAINANFNLDHVQVHPTKDIEEEIIEEEIAEATRSDLSSETIEKQSFSSWLHANEAQKRSFFDEEKDRIDSILNKFIEDEPKISRPLKENFEPIKEKTEFFSPVKKAKQSLDSTAMPVSETLAKIFAVQGNYPKAIYAYEQLCLIYPEKKIFFASQIEELKQKLNT
jgi:hypothetical protein